MKGLEMDIAIVGAGPAGVMAAVIAKRQNPQYKITVFDKASPLRTLLYTGGGRCNLTYGEFDFKELASHYPRGEKFLYSVFSQFDVSSTFEFFENEGLGLYIQEDNRVFPKTDKASDVRNMFFELIKKYKIRVLTEEVVDIQKTKDGFKLHSDYDFYEFDKVVISAGGRYKNLNSGFDLAKSLGHKVTSLSPCLCGLSIKEKWVKEISGVTLKQIKAYAQEFELKEDFVFTHSGISGPLSFKISSLLDLNKYSKTNPLIVKINLVNKEFHSFDKELVDRLNLNPKKDIANVLSDFIPRSLVEVLLKENKIDNKKAFEIDGKTRKIISGFLTGLKLEITGVGEKGEMVTKGGVSLDEINSKSMESKIHKGLFFVGEVLNIDGFTGGFNLQACFSTGFVAGKNL